MFLEWNDEKYSQRLSKRVKDGITTSIEKGTYTGGYLIYGYKLVDTDKIGKKGIIHKVGIDEEQAEIVRYIFTEYAKGTPKKEIADALNAKGLRYKGKPFHFKTFEGMLKNRKYTGEFTIGDRLCDNIYPQIIDKLTFEKVQQKLVKNRILAGANSAIEPYYLTGKAFCGHCGTNMTSDGATAHGKKHYYYVCNKKRKNYTLCVKKRENKDAMELFVVQCVRDFLSDPKNADKAASDTIAFHERKTSDSGLKSVDARIGKIKAEVDEMTMAFIGAKSALLKESIEKKMAEYEILLDDLKAQKAQLELERGLKVTKEHILLFIKELLKGDEKDKEYQRKIIDNLVYMVYISDGDVVVYLNINGDKTIVRDNLTLDDTQNALSDTQDAVLTVNITPNSTPIGVRTQNALVHQMYQNFRVCS